MMKGRGMKTICIDFDGVIYPNMMYKGNAIQGSPTEGAREALEELSKEYNIVINSSRFQDDDAMEVVRQWLIENDMDYELSKHKPHAHAYLDDRGINFDGNWEKAVENIKSFRQYQEDDKKRAKNMRRMSKRGAHIIRE